MPTPITNFLINFPVNPSVGQMYRCNSNNIDYCFIDNQWIAIAGPREYSGYAPYNPLTITNLAPPYSIYGAVTKHLDSVSHYDKHYTLEKLKMISLKINMDDLL